MAVEGSAGAGEGRSAGGFGAQRRIPGDRALPRGTGLDALVQLVAPINVPGLQIAWQAPPNSEVKEGDVVMRFDSSLAQQQLLEKQAALKQAQATLDQAITQAQITAEQDRLDLASAHVTWKKPSSKRQRKKSSAGCKARRARSIWGWPKKSCACRRRPSSCTKCRMAKIASLTRQRDKAQQDIDITNERLANMEMHAPSAGVVVYFNNYSQGGSTPSRSRWAIRCGRAAASPSFRIFRRWP